MSRDALTVAGLAVVRDKWTTIPDAMFEASRNHVDPQRWFITTAGHIVVFHKDGYTPSGFKPVLNYCISFLYNNTPVATPLHVYVSYPLGNTAANRQAAKLGVDLLFTTGVTVQQSEHQA